MIVKGIVDEDFTNYKSPSMLIIFPKCSSWKCGKQFCHNREIATMADIEIDTHEIVRRYMNNSITSAIVFSGLEPFDSPKDLIELATAFREETLSPIIIYTGYTEDEIQISYPNLCQMKNLIIKFGRYVPGHQPHYDDALGVNLSSDNQYARHIS